MSNTMQFKQWKDRHPRVIESNARLSTAQRSIAASNPVSISFAQTKMDPEELRRSSARVMNLQQIVTHAFEGSVAGFALHAEMAPDRLRPLLDMQVPFSAEIAEHLEKCLNLPGGWLDNKRGSLDVEHLKEMIFAPTKSSPALGAGGAACADENPQAAAAQEAVATKEVAQETPQAAVKVQAAAAQEPVATKEAVMLSAHELVKEVAQETPHAAKPQAPVAQEPAVIKADAKMSDGAAHLKVEPKRLDYPMIQVLVWLNKELDRFRSPKGGPVRPEIAESMGRAPSTLSTWLTGVRKMPDEMLGPLVQAIHKVSPALAVEMQERVIAVDPAIARYLPNLPKMDVPVVAASPVAPVVAPVAAAMAAPAVAAAAVPVAAAIAEPAPASAPVSAGSSSLDHPVLGVGGQGTPQEFNLAVARAVDRFADILQKLLDRPA